MTLLNPDGTLLSKEIYKYEFDFAGNWNKMTTSVAVVDARGITFEASEVTYRAIMYYLDENMVKMVTPGTTTTTPEATTPPTAVKPPVADPKANAANASANKSHNNSKTVTPDLPAASNAATKLAAGPVDVKSPSATSTQTVPVVNLDSEPPPTPGPRPILKPISGGVLNGTAVSLPQPSYPDAAKRSRTQGVVTVDVVLDESGKVISANASSGPSLLRDAAVQAALRARFSPTKLSGQPVKVSGVINYKFTLLN
jgi:TonB family protein